MSYCRWGPDSDVYVYPTSDGSHGLIVCCGCPLLPGDVGQVSESPQEMIAHLERHVAAGHKVPEAAFERLRREAAGKEDEPW